MPITPLPGYGKPPTSASTTITIGNVTTLSAGSSATAEITGTAPNFKLNLGIPVGSKGDNGLTPNLSIGTVSTLSPGSVATVEITGTAPNQVLNFGIPAGKDGISPSALTITIGTVTTLASGSAATAKLSGTGSALVLDLGIPAGKDAANPNPLAPTLLSAMTLAFDTAYQISTTKQASLSVMIEAVYTITVAAALADVIELWIGPDATVATATTAAPGNAKKFASFSAGLTGIAVSIGMSTTHRNQLFGIVPAGYYFAVRKISGKTAVVREAFSQALT